MFRNLGHGSVFIRIERQRRASYRDSHGVLGRLYLVLTIGGEWKLSAV